MVKISEYDTKLMQMVKRRNLSSQSIENYNIVFTEIFKQFNKLPSELLEEFREEEQPYINKEGNIRIKPIEDRKITKYQYQYDNYLTEKYNSEKTKKGKQNLFRAFLREYNIELPKPIIYNTPPIRIRTKDLPTYNDVNRSFKFCNSMEKAIISLISTSGIRISDISNFKIQDFLEATSLYHNGDINKLLERNPLDIIPYWDFIPIKTQKLGNICITFNIGECSYYLFEYLKERNNLEQSLKPNTPLFQRLKNKNPLNSKKISKIFQKLNTELQLGKDKNGQYGKFRAHNLRKLFSTTCRRNISKIAINSDNYHELDTISIFMGHTPPNTKNSYVYVAVDDEDGPDNYLRQTYEALMPYFKINTDIDIIEKTSNEGIINEI